MMIQSISSKTVLLLSLIGSSFFCKAQEKNGKLPLTLSAIWNGTFNERSLQMHMSNTENKICFIVVDSAKNWEGICRLDFETGKLVDTVFSNQVNNGKDSTPVIFTFFNDFEFSPDDKNILLRTEIAPQYVLSEKSFNYIWNIEKQTLKMVTAEGKQSYATFSPDGKMLAFIRDGNLYIKQLDNGQMIAVTYDGAKGDAVNGMGDMLYENGFGITRAFEWSPDSKRIAYVRLNETVVKNYPITYFSRSYPNVEEQRYPIAGEPPPEPQIFIYEIKDKIPVRIDEGQIANQYIVGIKWHPDSEHLYFQQLNRSQTILNLCKASVKNGHVTKIFADSSDAYIDVVPNNIFPIAYRKSLLWLSEKKDGRKHIYEMGEDGDSLRQINKGDWEDFDIRSVNEETGEIFFTSNETSSREKQLYKVNIDGSGRKRLTDQEGWHNSLLTKDNRFFIDEYSSVNSPTTYRMYNTQGKALYEKLIYNVRLRDTMSKYRIPNVDFYTPRINDSTQLNAYVIRPTKATGQKLPLIIYVYGGQSKKEVTNQWTDKQTLTMRYLAEQGYYVACVDPRGTPGKGAAFRNASYDHPGEVEMEDIVAFKKYLTSTLRLNIDTNKTAIMGWSYGGFLAALAQTKYAGQFKAAVAIAPVTNWRLYDNVYTERLLKLPSENAEQYRSSSPVKFVDNYKGGLFLIHGTSDDIVHLNNSMELSTALTKIGKEFDQHLYPDKTHGLNDEAYDNATRVDLYKRIDKFLKEQFNQ